VTYLQLFLFTYFNICEKIKKLIHVLKVFCLFNKQIHADLIWSSIREGFEVSVVVVVFSWIVKFACSDYEENHLSPASPSLAILYQCKSK